MEQLGLVPNGDGSITSANGHGEAFFIVTPGCAVLWGLRILGLALLKLLCLGRLQYCGLSVLEGSQWLTGLCRSAGSSAGTWWRSSQKPL